MPIFTDFFTKPQGIPNVCGDFTIVLRDLLARHRRCPCQDVHGTQCPDPERSQEVILLYLGKCTWGGMKRSKNMANGSRNDIYNAVTLRKHHCRRCSSWSERPDSSNIDFLAKATKITFSAAAQNFLPLPKKTPENKSVFFVWIFKYFQNFKKLFPTKIIFKKFSEISTFQKFQNNLQFLKN